MAQHFHHTAQQLKSAMAALGWQGGTIHQVCAEIKIVSRKRTAVAFEFAGQEGYCNKYGVVLWPRMNPCEFRDIVLTKVKAEIAGRYANGDDKFVYDRPHYHLTDKQRQREQDNAQYDAEIRAGI